MAISDLLTSQNKSEHARIKAQAHLEAVPLNKDGLPDQITRDGITVIFDDPPKLIQRIPFWGKVVI